MFFCGGRFKPALSTLFPGDQAIEIVTVGSVGAESILIEEALDTTIEADLVGMVLGPDGPTHLAVPATSEYHYPGARQTCCQQAPRPQPTTLLLLTHFTETGKFLPQFRI